MYSSPLEILSCIDLEFRRTSSRGVLTSPGRILSLGERDSWNERVAELKKYKKKDEGKGRSREGNRNSGNADSCESSRPGSFLRSWVFIETDSTRCISSFRRDSIRLDKKGRNVDLYLDPLRQNLVLDFSSIDASFSPRCLIVKFRLLGNSCAITVANSSGDSAGRFAINAFDRVDVRSRMTITYR